MWKCTGIPSSSLSALTSVYAASRLAEPGHVLDAEDVRAGGLQLAAHLEVVVERVLGFVGRGQVARVADGRFAQLAGLEHGVDGDAHVLHPVERVEHAEHVDAGGRGLLHEGAHHVVRVVGVAHGVRRAQQHLQQQVGHGRAELLEPRPRILAQEAHGHVERGAAPAFHGEQLRQHVRVVRRDGGHVGLAHARGQQRLVRVAHGRVGDQHALLRQHPLRETFGAELVELLLRARRRRLGHIHLGQARQHHALRLEAPFHFRIAVDDDLADEREDARGTVALLFPLEELGRLVDELGGVFGGARTSGA